MKTILLTLALAAVTVPAMGQVILYGEEDYQGRSIAPSDMVRDLGPDGFSGQASSAIVRGASYEFCEAREFRGRCVVLPPGRYPSLAAMGMDNAVASLRLVGTHPREIAPPRAIAPPPREIAPPRRIAPPREVAEITLFGREDFRGRSFSTHEPVRNLNRQDFGDRASSAIVRGGRFEICDGRGFQGRCLVLRPGQYPSLEAMGMNDAIASVRPVPRQAQLEAPRFAPPPPVAYDYRRRRDERLFEAEVVAVRAVYGRPEQQCWVEREAVSGGDTNVGGAIAGAIIGGILGHQVGSGRGNDAATAAGAVAGAALGSNFGGTTYSRDVQRCSRSQMSGSPQYWDVTYRFRGVDRYVQMTRPPGRTITVNRDGEPRAAS